MSIVEAAVERFGPEWVRALEESVGCHSRERAPAEREARLIFGLLEAVDFDCPRFDWDCPGRRGSALAGVTMEALKAFLMEHGPAVRAYHGPPPSYLGLLTGDLDFLKGSVGSTRPV